LNDLATFNVVTGRKYHVVARIEGRAAEADFVVSEAAEQLITLTLREQPAVAPKPRHELSQNTKPLPAKDAAKLKGILSQYFAAEAASQLKWKFSAKLEKLLRQNEPAVRQTAWEAYRTSPIHANVRSDFEAHIVKSSNYQSAYTVKTVGQRPGSGWALFIAMHGGGNAPAKTNCSHKFLLASAESRVRALGWLGDLRPVVS
jgi:hypothetical protein